MYVGYFRGSGGGGVYGVATVGGMLLPHTDGAALDITIIESCCCVAAISSLNHAMLLLLRCTLELLAIIKTEKPLRMVPRM